MIDATGELDATSTPHLCGPVLRFVEAGQSRFVLDLGNVGRVDATGARDLADLVTRIRSRGGTLAVTGGPKLRAALRAAGVEHEGLVHDTVAEAARACRAGLTT